MCGTLQPDSQHFQQTFSHQEVFPSYTFECFNGNLQLYSESVPLVSDWMQFTVQRLQVSLAYKVWTHDSTTYEYRCMQSLYHLPTKSQEKNQYNFLLFTDTRYYMQHTQHSVSAWFPKATPIVLPPTSSTKNKYRTGN